MAGLEDLIRSSAPGGSIGKPLLLALLALLASGALFRGGGTSARCDYGVATDIGRRGWWPARRIGRIYWTNCRKGGLGDVANSWVGSGQNQPVVT